jgi:multidrug resistance efflux pump
VVDQANETFAEQEDKRYAELATKGYGSLQNAQQAASRIAAARATVARDNAALASATRQLDVIQAELGQAIAAIGATVRRQALVMGFSDTFAVIGTLLAIAAIVLLFARKVGVGSDVGGAH